LLGFLAPTSGTVHIDGLDPRRYVERNGVGYLSELVSIPPAWRLPSALRRYAVLAGVPADALDARVEAIMAMLGLEDHRHKRVRQLSKGNLQRLGLGQALLRHERVIVLDEPTHGLDPLWTQRFRDVVDQLRGSDCTILIASHNLDELARLADRVGIIDRGQLQRVVNVRESQSTIGERMPYRLIVARGETRVAEVFPTARAIGEGRGEFEVQSVSLDEINAGLAALVQRGVLVRAVYPMHSALEQQFREAVGVPADAREGEERR
jgi:ABC-type multidrug transport system ATPase subunit